MPKRCRICRVELSFLSPSGAQREREIDEFSGAHVRCPQNRELDRAEHGCHRKRPASYPSSCSLSPLPSFDGGSMGLCCVTSHGTLGAVLIKTPASDRRPSSARHRQNSWRHPSARFPFGTELSAPSSASRHTVCASTVRPACLAGKIWASGLSAFAAGPRFKWPSGEELGKSMNGSVTTTPHDGRVAGALCRWAAT